MKLNAQNVTRLSVLFMAVMTAIAGLIGNQQIVKRLEEQVILHGVAHNREVSANLRPILLNMQRENLPREQTLRHLQQLLTNPVHAQNGYAIFLLDAHTGKILAPSENEQETAQSQLFTPDNWLAQVIATASQAKQSQEAWFMTGDGNDSALLTTLLPALPTAFDDSTVEKSWYFVIRTDVSHLSESMHLTHYRISLVLLSAVGTVAVWGLWTLRRLGRRYETHLEQSLEARTRQLQDIHAEMLDKARLVTLGQTASMLAHEIRNPLASMRFGLSGLLSAGYLRERDQRRVELVLGEVSRLNEMLSDTLNYARAVRLSPEPVNLDDIIAEILPLAEPLMNARQLQLKYEISKHCQPVRLDTNQIKQVLINLLKNAAEASPVEGQIKLIVSQVDNKLRVQVTNTGNPLPEADIDRLFEPFYTTKPNGSGLGLWLVKRVIEEHGGRVEVESHVQQTCFGFTLPVAQTQQAVTPVTSVPEQARTI